MNVVSTPSKVRLSLESAGVLMTPDEFDAVTDYDDCYRYELIHELSIAQLFAISDRWDQQPPS